MLQKAMLLAAGRGTRLRPLTDGIPKAMIRIGGKPLLEHTIEHLAGLGIRELVINLYHRPELVQGHFGDGRRWGVRIHYSIERELLGTAGGVKEVQDLLGDGPFVVWYADNLSRCHVHRMYQFHRRRRALITVALYHRKDPTASGIVGVDRNGRIERFLEKPRLDQIFSHRVSAGILIVEPAVLDIIPAQPGVDFGRDVLPLLLVRGERLFGYPLSDSEGLWWIDTPADLERVQSAWEMRSVS